MFDCYNRSKCICVNLVLCGQPRPHVTRIAFPVPALAGGRGRVGPGLTKQLTISSAHAATQIYACQEKENISSIPPPLVMYFLLTCVGGGNFLVKIKDAFFSFYCHISPCCHASVCTSHMNVFSILILLIN